MCLAAIIFGLDVLVVQEEIPLEAEESAQSPGSSQGPPFFVEGLKAKPAVDGSLELTQRMGTLCRRHTQVLVVLVHGSSSSCRCLPCPHSDYMKDEEIFWIENRRSHCNHIVGISSRLLFVWFAAQGWLTVLGCSECLRPHHNYFSVDCGGYALTHLRLGVRSLASVSLPSPSVAASSPSISSVARTVVLRFRVYGQVALGAPHPLLESIAASSQRQEQWPPRVIEDVTSLLHGAAVIVGPNSGPWASHNKQELLLPRAREAASRRNNSSSL